MKKFRFDYLLACLAAVIFVQPFFPEQALGGAILDVFLLLTLLSGAFVVIEHRRTFQVIVGLGVVFLIGQVALRVWPSPAAISASLAAGLLLYLGVTWALLRSLFLYQQRVTRDTLSQALSVYLLMGIVGAFAYALLESLVPGSFTIGGEPTPADARFDRYIGFSFTTLTTLGYGNIVPTNPRADALTSLQAIAGPVYLTIVIARLVAIQVGQQEQASDQTQR